MPSVKKEKIAKAFDKGAPSYDWAALIQREVAQKLASFLPQEAPQNILEIGCGTGFLTKILAQKYPDAHITAIDISERMIEKCQTKLPTVSFEKSDGETYSPSQKFDLIVSNMTVQWFEDPANGIERFKDFLNPNGHLLYSTLGKDNFKEWKNVLKNLNISSDFSPSPQYKFIIDEEKKNTMYHDGFDFIKNLKDMGAHHSSQKPLSTAQLKKACKILKEKYYCSITWHILYGHFTQPA